jgi:hypothetical protein
MSQYPSTYCRLRIRTKTNHMSPVSARAACGADGCRAERRHRPRSGPPPRCFPAELVGAGITDYGVGIEGSAAEQSTRELGFAPLTIEDLNRVAGGGLQVRVSSIGHDLMKGGAPMRCRQTTCKASSATPAKSAKKILRIPLTMPLLSHLHYITARRLSWP